MKRLHNSKGKHIANFANNQLHAPSGTNIGHYLAKESIFIDMSGRYLGEIVSDNRLLYNQSSAYSSISFGSHGDCGNIGNAGNPGNVGSIGVQAGFADVPEAKLK